MLVPAMVAHRAEAPIKVVHIWLAVIVMACTFLGGMVMAVFQVGQWNGAVTVRMDRQLEVSRELVEKIESVARQAQESHDFILQNKMNIEALSDRAEERRPSRRVPVLSAPWETVK